MLFYVSKLRCSIVLVSKIFVCNKFTMSKDLQSLLRIFRTINECSMEIIQCRLKRDIISVKLQNCFLRRTWKKVWRLGPSQTSFYYFWLHVRYNLKYIRLHINWSNRQNQAAYSFYGYIYFKWSNIILSLEC